MDTPKGGSVTAEAYSRIRADILACRLAPGRKLNIADLRTAMGVNLGAVREALSRLTSEGLVEAEPRKGFRVVPITTDDLRDITNVRVTIESLCLENAIINGDLKWETGIVSTLFELSRLEDPKDPARASDQWAETHQRFHEALVAACDSPWLLRLRSILFIQSERYRRASVSLSPVARNLHDEHKAIAEAAVARDAAKACMELQAHLKRTTRILMDTNVVDVADKV